MTRRRAQSEADRTDVGWSARGNVEKGRSRREIADELGSLTQTVASVQEAGVRLCGTWPVSLGPRLSDPKLGLLSGRRAS